MSIRINQNTHHSLAFISDSLDHNVEFVHAAQYLAVEFVRRNYPNMKHFNYVTDGATQHFKSNKSIINLTYHYHDFGVIASWTFSATAHGKSSADGIGASIKYRAARRVLSGTRDDAILTPKELFDFASQDTSLSVLFLDIEKTNDNTRRFNLRKRWC